MAVELRPVNTRESSLKRSGLLACFALLLVMAAACGDSERGPVEQPAVSEGTTSSVAPPTTTTPTVATTVTTVDTTTPATVTTVASTTTAAPVPTIDPPPVLREDTPPLVDIDGWLASDVTSLEELRGSVVVVEFWTFGCYNCKNRIPYTQDLYAKYKDQGMEIVGIHSPEFNYERDVANIEQAMVDLGVTWPVVLDTDRRTFREWQGRPAYWPRTYVLDKQGRIRFDHIGEGAYEELFQVVDYLLTESA